MNSLRQRSSIGRLETVCLSDAAWLSQGESIDRFFTAIEDHSVSVVIVNRQSGEGAMKISSLILAGVFVLPILSACSDAESSDQAVVGNVVLANSKLSDNATLTLTKMVECKRDATFGYFKMVLQSSDGVSALEVAVKGFKSVAQTYTCLQASDNKTLGSVGGLFDECGVSVAVPSPVKGSNGYRMYRSETEQNVSDAFSYAGECRVDFLEVSPVAKGKVACTKMVQVMYAGVTSNPIEATKTADLTASFECPLQ
jgi:hypothetical protein